MSSPVNPAKNTLIWLWVSVVMVVADLWSKFVANSSLSYGVPVEVLPVFDLRLSYNTGAAFSFLADAGGMQRWFFAVIGVAVSVFLLVWMKRTPRWQWWVGLAQALVLGGALGFLLLIAISLAGFGTLLAASEQVFTLIKWIGAAYLVYLGVRVWRSSAPDFNRADRSTETPASRPFRMFQQGFIVAISNPKGILFFAAFLPQFIAPDTANPLPQMLLLSAVFMLMTLVVFIGYGLFADKVRGFVLSSPKLVQKVQRCFAGIFVMLGAKLAMAER